MVVGKRNSQTRELQNGDTKINQERIFKSLRKALTEDGNKTPIS